MLLQCYDIILISEVCKVNDDAVNDAHVCCRCSRWEEPRFEIVERETVIRCECDHIVVCDAIDVAAQLVFASIVDERDALIADVGEDLIQLVLMRAIRLVVPLTDAQIEAAAVDFADVVRPTVVVLAYRVQLALAVTVIESVAEQLFEMSALAVSWVRFREHPRQRDYDFLFHVVVDVLLIDCSVTHLRAPCERLVVGLGE